MSLFSPIRQIMECTGLDLAHPADRMPQGKFPFLQNVRPVQETSLTSMPGYGLPLNPAPFDQTNIHSIRRMNNSLAGANPASRRFVGADTKLYSADVGMIDSGYSGNPMSLVVWRPDQSVEPWMYVGDSARMQKCRMNGDVQNHYDVGIAPPAQAPQVILDQPHYKEIDDFFATPGSYVAAGTATGHAGVMRSATGTVIGLLIYDAGGTGWANVVPFNHAANYGWIGRGTLVTFSQGMGNGEEVVVQEVHLQVATSTILGIAYDTGTTGNATVQAAQPLAGLDINSMMQFNPLGSNEVVPVLSFTIGPDGLYSFRVFLTGTHVVGEVLQGLPSFRCYTTEAHFSSEPITATAIQTSVANGVGTITRTVSLDLSQCSFILGGGGIAGRPLTPDDYMHISIMVDKPQLVVQGLIEFDVDATTNDFTQNYYQQNFQPNLQQALLTGGATALDTLGAAAQDTLINEVLAPAGGPGFAGAAASANTVPGFLQLYGGNNAWTEIQIPLIDLTRVGADTTRSVANVAAIRISLQTTGTVVMTVSSWWVGGGYGPDTGLAVSQRLIWRYRYRASLTGAKSQQSPGIRTSIQAFRQQVLITPFVSTDFQVDQIDIERFGGVLNEWHYVGTIPNDGSTFADTYSDDDIKTAPALETDAVMPFPSFDVPKTGTCNVVGTQVTWVSGDLFQTNVAPGQEILIAGIPYIVYGQPLSATSLQTVENVGVLTGAPYLIAEPTLIGQPLPHIIGPIDQGFLLAWGDPRNPGVVYATKGNDPDSAPINYYLEIANPSEPVVGGVIWDNSAIVFTTKRCFRLNIDGNAIQSGQGNVIVATELQVGRGLFAPWAICAGPLVWFLDEAGVPCATDGSRAVSIVEEDLRPLFPHDGEQGKEVNTYFPPDLNQPTKLRFVYANGLLYFFYVDTNCVQQCLIYNPVRKGWWPRRWNIPMNLCYFEEGQSLDSLLLGGQDGNLYQVGGFSDNTVGIPATIGLPYNNGGSPRTEKFYGDAMLDIDPQSIANVTLAIICNLGGFVLAPVLFAGSHRRQYPMNINSGNGQLARSISAGITWSSNVAAATVYNFEVMGYDTLTVLRTTWASLPTSHGLSGWQSIREGYLPLWLEHGGTVNLVIVVDGVAQPPISFTPNSPVLTKMRVDFAPTKGKLYEYQLYSTTPFLIFEKDLEVMAKSWGTAGPYQNVRPFGDG